MFVIELHGFSNKDAQRWSDATKKCLAHSSYEKCCRISTMNNRVTDVNGEEAPFVRVVVDEKAVVEAAAKDMISHVVPVGLTEKLKVEIVTATSK